MRQLLQFLKARPVEKSLVVLLVLGLWLWPPSGQALSTKIRVIVLRNEETFHTLAQQYLGSADKWNILQRLNRRLARRYRKDPDRPIPPGTRVIVPEGALVPETGPASPAANPEALELALPQSGLGSASSPPSAKVRVAILPFATPKDRPEIEQYGTGTMDSLIAGLKNVPQFIMIERGRIEQIIKEVLFAQTGLVQTSTAVRLGRLLQADVLIVGSIQTSAEQVRIIANFIDVQTGAVKDSQGVIGTDIFSLQDELANLFIMSQSVVVTEASLERIDNVLASTNSLSAYDYYLKGRKAYLLFTPAGLAEGIKWYKQAIEVDPQYALAYTGLAEAWVLSGFDKQQKKAPYRQDYEQALHAARKALELNPNLAEAHRSYGQALYYLDEQGDEEQVRKALELNPNDAETWYALWLVSGNTVNPNHTYIRKALELNPDLSAAHSDRGSVLFRMKRYEEALKEFQEVLRINPGDATGYYNSALVYAARGTKQQALNLLAKALTLDPALKNVAREDANLRDLRDDPRFQQLTAPE